MLISMIIQNLINLTNKDYQNNSIIIYQILEIHKHKDKIY